MFLVTLLITGQISIPDALKSTEILSNVLRHEILCISLDDLAARYALGAISGICQGKICK